MLRGAPKPPGIGGGANVGGGGGLSRIDIESTLFGVATRTVRATSGLETSDLGIGGGAPASFSGSALVAAVFDLNRLLNENAMGVVVGGEWGYIA